MLSHFSVTRNDHSLCFDASSFVGQIVADLVSTVVECRTMREITVFPFQNVLKIDAVREINSLQLRKKLLNIYCSLLIILLPFSFSRSRTRIIAFCNCICSQQIQSQIGVVRWRRSVRSVQDWIMERLQSESIYYAEDLVKQTSDSRCDAIATMPNGVISSSIEQFLYVKYPVCPGWHWVVLGQLKRCCNARCVPWLGLQLLYHGCWPHIRHSKRTTCGVSEHWQMTKHIV